MASSKRSFHALKRPHGFPMHNTHRLCRVCVRDRGLTGHVKAQQRAMNKLTLGKKWSGQNRTSRTGSYAYASACRDLISLATASKAASMTSISVCLGVSSAISRVEWLLRIGRLCWNHQILSSLILQSKCRPMVCVAHHNLHVGLGFCFPPSDNFPSIICWISSPDANVGSSRALASYSSCSCHNHLDFHGNRMHGTLPHPRSVLNLAPLNPSITPLPR